MPDVEARVFDGKVYLYGSTDIPGNTEYGSNEYHVFSSDDLVQWANHGLCFSSDDLHSDPSKRLFAPDCIYYNGLYHLFYCTEDNREGVATSAQPHGPFRDSFAITGPDGDSIDPAVLVDDDGSVYYFWGQFHLRGARMNDDLLSLDESTLNTSLLTEENDGFHEGASIRKRGDLYYMVYTDTSRGRATCLAYATASAPLGPYTKRGIIIDNTGCDPETWNNHGSIQEFKGDWYVFYHRSSNASRFSRRLCIERIQFDSNGLINEVPMTSNGVTPLIDTSRPLEARRACLLEGEVRLVHQREDSSAKPVEVLSMIEDGDAAVFHGLKISTTTTTFHVKAASAAYGGVVEVRVQGSDGPVLARCLVQSTGGWSDWNVFSAPVVLPVEKATVIYLTFKGSWGRLFDIHSFWFE